MREGELPARQEIADSVPELQEQVLFDEGDVARQVDEVVHAAYQGQEESKRQHSVVDPELPGLALRGADPQQSDDREGDVDPSQIDEGFSDPEPAQEEDRGE